MAESSVLLVRDTTVCKLKEFALVTFSSFFISLSLSLSRCFFFLMCNIVILV